MNGDTRINFPVVAGSNLDGHKYSLPNDFKGNLNIVMIAFRREQTNLIEGWTNRLEELVGKNPTLEYYELPVLSTSYSPFRWWIDGGMRAGILDDKARQRTITVYTNKKVFKNQLGISDEGTIYIFLVSRNGKILWRTQGGFTEEKHQQLQHIAEENSIKKKEKE